MLGLLKETGILGVRASSIAVDPNHKVGRKEEGAVDRGRYQRLVGRLIFLCHTRPDIAYVVGVGSLFMHDPKRARECSL